LERTYYRILNVPPSASTAEIKRAYHTLAREYHPDSSSHSNSEELFKEIAEAYATLSNPKKRLEYDLKHRIVQTNYEKIREYEKAASYTESAAEQEPKREENINRASHTFKYQGAEAVNLNSARFSTEQPGALGKLFSKILDIPAHKERFSELLNRTNNSTEKSENSTKRTAVSEDFFESLRGERQYQFSIDTLESLHGTSRELALQVNGKPKTIRVSIPAGVQHGTTLRLNPSGKGEEIKIKILLTPNSLIERDGNDIIVKLPISLSEAVNGAEIEVPTLDGPVLVKLPPHSANRSRKLRLKGRGCKGGDSTAAGDLYVETYVAIPAEDTQAFKDAVKVIEEYYQETVRRDIPKKL